MRTDIPDGTILAEMNKTRTVYQLAKTFSCHHQQIQSRIRKAGYCPILANDKRTINQNSLPDDLPDQYNQPKTTKEIAKQYSVTPDAVSKKLSRLNYKPRKKGPPKGGFYPKKNLPLPDKLAELYNDGYSITELAKKFSVANNTIWYRLKLSKNYKPRI